jgi:HTH-type transcriptional regulator, sugar sensing transcriptional regulator
MQDLKLSLENLGLAKAEVFVYLDILQNANANGSQISKRVDLPKPSVYLALDKLYQRGLINLIPGKTKQYQAQDVIVALEKLRAEYNANLDNALAQIQQIQQVNVQEEFIHILGYSNFSAQLKAIFTRTERELYLQTNMDLNLFALELSYLVQKGVRVIVYSFGVKFNYPFAIEEYYDTAKPILAGFRMLAVADYVECLMSCGRPDSEYLAIYTKQKLQVSLLAENIHNSIYWLKLYREQPNFCDQCRLATLAEEEIHLSGYSL